MKSSNLHQLRNLTLRATAILELLDPKSPDIEMMGDLNTTVSEIQGEWTEFLMNHNAYLLKEDKYSRPVNGLHTK
jgi:hypothetical protein